MFLTLPARWKRDDDQGRLVRKSMFRAQLQLVGSDNGNTHARTETDKKDIDEDEE